MGHYQGMSSQFFIWKLTAVSMEICQLSPTFRTGITQSLRLEKTFKINKSNHCSSTAKSITNHVPRCYISTSFQYLQGLYQGHYCRGEGTVSPLRNSSSLLRNGLAQLCTGMFHSLPCLHISLLGELRTHRVNQSDKNL